MKLCTHTITMKNVDCIINNFLYFSIQLSWGQRAELEFPKKDVLDAVAKVNYYPISLDTVSNINWLCSLILAVQQTNDMLSPTTLRNLWHFRRTATGNNAN